MNRRSFLTKAFMAGGALLLTPTYSFFKERLWYEEKHVTISIPFLPNAMNGLRVVHFSDLHAGHFYGEEQLAELVRRINLLQPDVLCFTGDLYDGPIAENDGLTELLAQLKASNGKFAVLGNHDYWDSPKKVTARLQEAGFTVLNNKHAMITKNNSELYIAGLKNVTWDQPDLMDAIKGIPKEACTLLLVHEPDFADRIDDKSSVSLQLSGHSHGGQIRLPGIGALITPPRGSKYVDGLYRLPGGLQVYTNRGIGTSQLPLRLFCRPEITILTLKRKM
ncbi:metallophosphoesterase [Paenibacillus swuensis]|uniref:metallophosphoesterase n=1 Tax=Paenibacillus swuensis TaxID=1178515 RepID=UPI000AE8FD9A|nr:metallophosphoesterase [Paenibacillus swuensis]